MTSVIFYHAGCPVCIDAERNILNIIDENKFKIEIVHLGDKKERVSEAKNFGVKSVPAIIIENQVFHINFGANLSDLEK